MLQHRMAVEADLAGNAERLRFRLNALKLDAVVGLHHLDAVQPSEEIEVPPGAAELPVGDSLQPHLFLFAHHVADRVVFDLSQLGIPDSPFRPRGPGLLQRRRNRFRPGKDACPPWPEKIAVVSDGTSRMPVQNVTITATACSA